MRNDPRTQAGTSLADLWPASPGVAEGEELQPAGGGRKGRRAAHLHQPHREREPRLWPYPSEELILKLAKALGVEADELLLLARKISERIRRRVLERPDTFRVLAALDDATLDLVLAEAEALRREKK